MARVTLEGIEKRFGAERVIDHLDLEIEEGEFLTLLGPSGCGKTTTLRIVAGFIAPDAGRVAFNGNDVTRIPTQSRKLGMVFQDYALFPHMTVADNVAFALRTRGTAAAEIARRVNELLTLIRLPDLAHRLPAELSGGQQQRVAIARALAHTPAVLLMDEPLGALDLKLREAMQDELHAIQRQLGITTIYVTHDQEEALSLSHRIAVMRGGRIEQLGTPREIYARPRTPFCAFFLGKVNFLQGRVAERLANGYRVMVGESTLSCPLGESGGTLESGTQVVLGIRPEHLFLDDAPTSAGRNRISGRIVREKFVGKSVQFEVEVGGAMVVVDGSPTEARGVRADVQVTWEVERTHVYPCKEDLEIGIRGAG